MSFEVASCDPGGHALVRRVFEHSGTLCYRSPLLTLIKPEYRIEESGTGQVNSKRFLYYSPSEIDNFTNYGPV
jgi:hypothetical protein